MKCVCLLFATVITVLVSIPSVGFGQAGQPDLSQLFLQLNTDKNVYLPGEPVQLRFRISPRSGAALAPAQISVMDGLLGLLVSEGSGDYLEYSAPGWGTRDIWPGDTVLLQQGQAVETMAIMLYNRAPETRHLSPDYAAAEERGKLRENYALSRAGIFHLKAVYYAPDFQSRIESDPVQVFVNDPTGEDLAVWEILRREPQLGYLLHTGVLPGASRDEDEDRAIATLVLIAERHLGSMYARHAESRLTQFRKLVQDKRRARNDDLR